MVHGRKPTPSEAPMGVEQGRVGGGNGAKAWDDLPPGLANLDETDPWAKYLDTVRGETLPSRFKEAPESLCLGQSACAPAARQRPPESMWRAAATTMTEEASLRRMIDSPLRQGL